MDAGGFASLTPDGCAALQTAPTIMGPSRHLSLLPDLPAQKLVWPVPFQAGIDQLLAMRGQPVAVLVSGDPFWFGAGSQWCAPLNIQNGWPCQAAAAFRWRHRLWGGRWTALLALGYMRLQLLVCGLIYARGAAYL